MRIRDGDDVMVRRAALRLGLQAAAGTLVVVALTAAAVVVTLLHGIAADDDARLRVTAAHTDDTGDPPDGMWVVLRTGGATASTPGLPAGFPITSSLDEVAAGGGPVVEAVSVAGHDYRVRTQARTGTPGSRSQVQVVLDAAPGEARVAALLRALALAGLGGLVLTAAAAVWYGRRAVRPLRAALVLQRQFVADAGHELRTPVTLLSTRAQMLRRRLVRPGADVGGEVDGLVADADRLAAILDDLLLAADPRAPGVEAAVDLAAVVEAVLAAATPAAWAGGVRLDLDVTGECQVQGSEAGLRRAVTAVVDNAVRHAAARVGVAITRTRDRVQIEVTDDGPGIDAAALPRVFDRFATGGGPRRYGLGLALVSDVLARHGGSITAQNRPGGGAMFRLILPAITRHTRTDRRE